jgi:hypothetical protein
MEQALAAEPIEKMEATEPTEPIERTDPAEPMDRTEPAEPMDQIDPLDPMLSSEPAEPADRDELSLFPMSRFSHPGSSAPTGLRRRLAVVALDLGWARQGRFYPSTAIDCATRKNAGWAMDDNYVVQEISSPVVREISSPIVQERRSGILALEGTAG